MTARRAGSAAARAFTTLAVLGGAAGCAYAPVSALERLTESRRLSAELLVQLTKAADAANRAVMAETDEASSAFSREARAARQAVQAGADTLAPLLQSLDYTAEARLLQEFRGRFAEYVVLDDRILDMAVESTNLKAQRLSFGPARQAADSVCDALDRIARPASDAERLGADVATVIRAVREIQVLQAPHIAEADAAAMTRLEDAMARSQETARRALDRLDRQIPSQARPQVDEARAGLDTFNALNAEIVRLSRRNSNVHSVALSLGHKRILNAACEERLQTLRDALAGRRFGGTR